MPPFKENGLPFWVPGVLRQHSEVVLWKLLSIQRIFRLICGGESGLPLLFLRHLGTPSLSLNLSTFLSLSAHPLFILSAQDTSSLTY